LYNSLGIEHFSIALGGTDRLQELDLSENNIGTANFVLLQRVFKKNINIELLNLADCRLNGGQAMLMCDSLMQNQKLKYLYIRNSNL